MSALHEQIGTRALELLPQWEREFWASELQNMPAYCCYPDTHLECQWVAPEKLPFYEKYCLMPNGNCIPHGLVNKDWIVSAFADSVDAETTESAVRYYCNMVVRCLKERDVTESARFAGTLGHFIQDACNLGHSFNNLLLNRMFPSENEKQLFFHGSLDSWPFCSEEIVAEPVLMGTTENAVAFHLTEALLNQAEANANICIPFLTAIKNDDHAAADQYSQAMNEVAVLYTANIWHTLFCIAFDKITDLDKQAFEIRDLTDSPMILSYDRQFNREQFIDAGIPFYATLYPNADPCRARLAVSPYPYEPTIGYALDAKNNRMPLKLRVDGTEVTGKKGIAGSNYSVASYRVPGNLYQELTVTAGVHTNSSTNGELVLGIWCHEAEEKLLYKGVVKRDGDALHITVSLPENCKTISLVSAGVPGEKSVVWLEPKLKARNS